MRAGWMMLVLIGVTGVWAQGPYSVWTLEGAWLMHRSPINPYDDNLNYLVFDGEGKIKDGNMFPAPVTGTYAVTAEGVLSGSMQVGNASHPLSGQLTSKREVSMGEWRMFKVTDPGAAGLYLTGEFSTGKCGDKVVDLRVNGSGQITPGTSGDLYPPFAGRIYADSGVFIGHLTTGDTADAWKELSVWGYMKGNTLEGKLGLDVGEGACGEMTVRLTRSATAGLGRKVPAKQKPSALKTLRWFDLLLGREIGISRF